MYFVYIIKNKGKKRYIGQTSNLSLRMERHNGNQVRSTKNRGPWILIYNKAFQIRKEAVNYERLLKSQKGGGGLKKILESLKAPE